jgi:hypothetical protein
VDELKVEAYLAGLASYLHPERDSRRRYREHEELFECWSWGYRSGELIEGRQADGDSISFLGGRGETKDHKTGGC